MADPKPTKPAVDEAAAMAGDNLASSPRSGEAVNGGNPRIDNKSSAATPKAESGILAAPPAPHALITARSPATPAGKTALAGGLARMKAGDHRFNDQLTPRARDSKDHAADRAAGAALQPPTSHGYAESAVLSAELARDRQAHPTPGAKVRRQQAISNVEAQSLERQKASSSGLFFDFALGQHQPGSKRT
ncbi:hypothetical protein Q5752_007111 [Cryptotrichosporon argae]